MSWAGVSREGGVGNGQVRGVNVVGVADADGGFQVDHLDALAVPGDVRSREDRVGGFDC
jgi:hypothetical protein